MKRVAAGLGAVLLSACSSAPTYGPSMMVLPGTNKTFDHFRLDEQDCRAHAQSQITKSGAEQDSAGSPQQRYDRSFLQCMYAKGHKVPLTGRVSDYIDSTQSTARSSPPPPPAGKPPAEAPPDFRPTK
ncbi:MAG TPA: hypothetical protein VEX18_11720 [Polyangiaceae bacterium]|nr:hypothetical protein [Polyangiaceae bacterium]